MPTMMISFPGRRYHATPWGSHVNEGLIEWPPSPWRLLRAMLSSGYTKLGWSDGSPPEGARSLIEKLAGVLPRYRLPQAVGSHSRHYMPTGVLAKGQEKKTLVFDTWAQINGDLCVTWDVDLTVEEESWLENLAENMGYLGRSESWISARLAGKDDVLPSGTDSVPCQGKESHGPGWEQVVLLTSVPPGEYLEWRKSAVESAVASLEKQAGEGKKITKKKREKAMDPYPIDTIACLEARTSWLHEHGWSQPPGSRKVLYWRRVDGLESGAPLPCRRPADDKPVEIMLLSMSTQSGNDNALPPVTRTLPQAELLHSALVGTAGKSLKAVTPCLSGCDEKRRPLKKGHRHAHILPLDLDGDGHLEHILIWSPMGLDAVAQEAIRAARRTYAKGGVGPLKLALESSGSLSDLRRMPGRYGERICEILGPADGATEWHSLTPFVLPRHRKKRGVNSIEGQIAAELASRGLPGLEEVQVLDATEGLHLRLRHFVRSRKNGPQPPVDCSLALAIRLSHPVSGPLCLGYGSHFGLGLFISSGSKPDPDDEA